MTTGAEVAEATATTVSGLAAGFMFDPATYVTGAERGFNGIDFYFAGRGGVLGDVGADVVAAAMVFFRPDHLRAQWDGSAGVMPRQEASAVFAGCQARWADEHLADDGGVDWRTLADLAGKVVQNATPGGAPLFAAWRAADTPSADRQPRQAALHQMNCLRELRLARHAAAVVVTGLDVGDAVRHRTPKMVAVFGWDDSQVADGVPALWDDAERLTNQASGRDYAVLDDDEATELVRLCQAATAAVR
jgi:hypothetical protein